ncbi:MAG: hypothetical protein K2Y02_04765, partial [Burkholderiaceae bacterium]|nr:hypothetical protein [Burkholderiaceae bacterium]
MTGSGNITQAIGQLVVSAAATLSGLGTVSATITGAIAAAAALAGSGDATGALRGLANAVAALSGVNTIVAGGTARANMSAAITSSGDVLTTANVADIVWKYVVEGNYTALEALRIQLAVAAGKTDVTDLGGGNATVTFRNLQDTKTRVNASMT